MSDGPDLAALLTTLDQHHVSADIDPDHAFFTTGPVVGLRVRDVDATREQMEAAGLEMLPMSNALPMQRGATSVPRMER